ncbi:unnamed protein product [Rotaria magnacalcarata]|uniref:Uncharacterized protein n=2 Tax=Rotaria magnacalcarata TaxID=392030 RepID=A0A816SUD3_9BILA|nr:unnamed protein product [Rotaria magnacalcarata]CAF2089821.1 unnamed protein product [Rotaria magnacalcarata]CAF4090194.1 unnamed protein product [Rotaria magnacalcarata]
MIPNNLLRPANSSKENVPPPGPQQLMQQQSQTQIDNLQQQHQHQINNIQQQHQKQINSIQCTTGTATSTIYNSKS